jgi:hypothetical protein
MRRAWLALLVLAGLWFAALVQRGAPVAADEIEFFRATRWIGEGKVPFRDFWEHHTPLQWVVFAPVARLFANGPGVESIVVMRWVQLALWIAIGALLVRLMRREGVNPWPALVLLLASATFVRKAVEYRVDVPGNLAYVAAVALIAFGATPARWTGFGALMSAAVLANMRLAPLVVITALLASFWRAEERRWRWNGRALWMGAGVAGAGAIFIGWLALTSAWTPFLDSILHYNVASATLLEVDTFLDAFLLPLWVLDAGGMAYWVAAAAGAVLALRGIRTPGPLQFVALLALASIATIAAMEVQYDYHFQNAWLLLVPLVAVAIDRLRRHWQGVVAIVAATSLTIFVLQVVPAFGVEIDYQDEVMTTADRLTTEGEAVFDGAGFALRREPAYRYWFLTTGVRMMAQARLIEPYDERDMAADPPAAVVADYRMRVYLQAFPRLARYATTHYLPLFRDLWVPGMTALVGPRPERVQWIAPRAGRYDVYASTALAAHPWLTDPLQYAEMRGATAPGYSIPLRRLPADVATEWSVDGIPQPRGVRTLSLRKGARVTLIVSPGNRAGVLLVPHGVDTLALAPADPFVF